MKIISNPCFVFTYETSIFSLNIVIVDENNLLLQGTDLEALSKLEHAQVH